ncbi:MAG: fibrillarin-like rRNA/tRNA 2'-O-methyltransferase [Archaeoglobaceae archaeon]|uniref:Fibrillarin-like rRNA/tRNA 2'-O-methyltransferase n=1 Tax=Archaeoglobus fulgidus TaxID=2234 RepID=A0A7J3M3X0_ARCFL
MRNVRIINGIPATKSKYGSHYGEKIIEIGGERYREWIPWRSKLSALILKGYEIEFRGDEKVLYLGASSGTTLSHLADIIDEGVIYAVEYSAKPFIKLLKLARERENVIPLLCDASKPWLYSGIVEKVDFIYQDVAQRNQVDILKANADFFLRNDGSFLLMVKAKSIDSTAEPKEVFDKVIERISKDFLILETGTLEPYHKDHIFILGAKI